MSEDRGGRLLHILDHAVDVNLLRAALSGHVGRRWSGAS